MENKKRIPDIGKLSIAILESIVKPVIGEDAIKVIKEPVKEKELQVSLIAVLKETEQRFIEEYDDKEIGDAILELPLANLPKLQEGLRKFYSHTTSRKFHDLLLKQLSSDYPNLEKIRIEKAVNKYLTILREELTQLPVGNWQRLVAPAIIEIQETLQALYTKFSESPALSTYIQSAKFRTLIEDRTHNFIGRDFIFEAVDNLTIDSAFPSGYIVVSGEPGIGKTAFMAEFVKRKGCVHHFNLSLQNIRTARDFLPNICAQLIVRYNLDYFTLPPDVAKDSGFLSQLLTEVAEKEKRKTTFILVDALDEADDVEISPGANVLYLPQSLPQGIYFVVTTRETHDYRLVVDRQKEIYIGDNDPQNLDDICKYISNYILENKEMIKTRIREWGISKEEFVDVITDKSEGNFMYLVYVLRDILDGKLSASKLENVHNLPKGLLSYYQRHWRMMRSEDKDHFKKYQEPVICFLATAREPITIDLIQQWTRLSPRQIKDVIKDWRAFLNVDTTGSETLYRIYHSSFQDFLKEEVGLVKYHERIAMTALRKIPGFLDGKS